MPKSICFVGYDNLPVLDPAYGSTYIGGESVQQSLLAKAFVQLGYDVSMVVKDHGQPDGCNVGGITVWKTYSLEAGLPVVRFVHPRATSLWRALGRADADIYYQSCAGAQTGIVALYCSRHRRKMVFRIAHDSDCLPGQELIAYARDRAIYRYGLKHADLVVSQSAQQQSLLQRHYSIAAPVIDMAVETPSTEETGRDIDVLWVNNIREFKRPELLLELARNNPQLRFTMIGGSCTGSESLYQRIRDGSADIDNLDYLGFVPYHEVNAYYQRARILVNTSDTEGFPNSFLQSWIRGTPVISFFDPDGIIERERLGSSPRDLERMNAEIDRVLGDDALYRHLSGSAREYAEKHYAAASVAAEYVRHFENTGILPSSS